MIAVSRSFLNRIQGLTSCLQTKWEEVEGVPGTYSMPRKESSGATAAGTAGAKGDENDPLGLMRGGVLA